MPSLRGSNRRRPNYPTKWGKPSLTDEVRSLKRRVGRNTPAKHSHLDQYPIIDAGGAGYDHKSFDLTKDFVDSSNFLLVINGEKYINHRLLLNCHATAGISSMRITLYVPKKTGTIYVPTDTPTGHATALDPATYWVISDFWVPTDPAANYSNLTKNISLQGFMTERNSTLQTVEKGQLKMLVRYHSNLTGNVAHISTRLLVSDK